MNYRDLLVWQRSIEFVDFIYDLTERFRPEERYGIKSQIRRAAVSVPSNIAEGHGRKHTKAYINHLSIAFGSLMEVETLAEISKRQKYFSPSKVDEILHKSELIGKMISGLKRSLKSKIKSKKSSYYSTPS